MTALQLFSPDTSQDVIDATEELVNDFQQVDAGEIGRLVEQYNAERDRIIGVGNTIRGADGLGGALYFFNSAMRNVDTSFSHVPESFFDTEKALKALDAFYWQKALAATDVYQSMPQVRRTEWTNTISKQTTPPFELKLVAYTLFDLLNSRFKFFAERVDGVFRALSKSHVSQVPQGFTSKLILGEMTTEKAGYIDDLRRVIARIQGDPEPSDCYTNNVLKRLERMTGVWAELDGGSLRIKYFKNGNVHVEVGREMAWRLNSVLASIYPAAIPSQFRYRRQKARPDVPLLSKPLRFDVVGVISEMKWDNTTGWHSWQRRAFTECQFVRQFEGTPSDELKARAGELLQSIGGVKCNQNSFVWYEFDYDPTEVIDHMLLTRSIPDHVSHQYFPTRAELSALAVAEADIQPGDLLLEPEAGQGGLAKNMPADRTTCVEISPLQAKILKAKGFDVVCADFIEWAKTTPLRFDKVISNPPFANGRAVLHITTSASLVKPGGRVVGILPGSLRGKDLLGPGWTTKWSAPLEGQFEGTGVTVAIMTAIKLG
jgi:hypothetical protein